MWTNIDQNTEEWFQLRCGRITSSELGKVMANYPNAFGEPAKKYAARLAVEQAHNEYIPSNYTNSDMERGHAEEPLARQEYERQYFVTVSPGGFYYEEPDEGGSPDGLVGDNGLIEIKSVLPHVHLNNIRRGKIEPAYKWQCWQNLRLSGREWIEPMSYSRIVALKPLFVHRVYAEDCQDEFEMIRLRLESFREVIADYRKLIE